ncbi:MAG: hypothetical protein ACUVRS_01635 [Armatimonadota bacterium]
MNASFSRLRDVADLARDYIRVLENRKSALLSLLATTRAIRDSLEAGGDASQLIDRRETECRMLEASCMHPYFSENCQYLQEVVPAEIQLRIEVLQSEIDQIGTEVLLLQSECENIIKSRLLSIADGLRESARRRQLESAYGATCKSNEVPFFIDKQR